MEQFVDDFTGEGAHRAALGQELQGAPAGAFHQRGPLRAAVERVLRDRLGQAQQSLHAGGQAVEAHLDLLLPGLGDDRPEEDKQPGVPCRQLVGTKAQAPDLGRERGQQAVGRRRVDVQVPAAAEADPQFVGLGMIEGVDRLLHRSVGGWSCGGGCRGAGEGVRRG